MPEHVSPLVIVLSLVVNFAMLAILFGGTYLWATIFFLWRSGETIVPFTPRRTVPWGFFDLLLGVVLWVMVTIVAVLMLRQGLNIDITLDDPKSMRDDLTRMMVDSLGRLLALALLAGLIALRTRCTQADLGWSFAQMGEDIVLGVKAFLVLALPTFLIQLVLTQFWPSAHPLVESLKKEPNTQFVVMAIFMAVISAPLAEEFFFRTLFQGWLEKLFDPIAAQHTNFGQSLLFGEQVETTFTAMPVSEMLPNEEALESEELTFATSPGKTVAIPPQATSWADYAPAGISAAVFALAHFSHGPDWIALIVLALGLGYLYRRTHRMLPGIVVHFLLNSLSMCSLLVQIFQPVAK
jgi:membrane protease YdiL (CAAX protease family)